MTRYKGGTEVTLNPLLNEIGDCNGDCIGVHMLLLPGRQVPRICKGFTNNSSGTIK